MLLIFDLDGTLFQAKSVVLHADRSLLNEMGLPAPDEETLLKKASRGVDGLLRNLLPDGTDMIYARARYIELVKEAILEYGALFPGAREAVERLALEGYELAVCSDSPIEYIELVLRHTRIAGAFAWYKSAEGYDSKAELIRETVTNARRTQKKNKLSGCGMSPALVRLKAAQRKQKTGCRALSPRLPATSHLQLAACGPQTALVMPGVAAVVIGDTHGDIEAAHANGFTAIAALYGYGNKSMLADAEHFVNAPEEIVGCIHEMDLFSTPDRAPQA